ncbi:MAG: hypothetical protein AB7O97_20665 [Planctomycetota bacterium]
MIRRTVAAVMSLWLASCTCAEPRRESVSGLYVGNSDQTCVGLLVEGTELLAGFLVQLAPNGAAFPMTSIVDLGDGRYSFQCRYGDYGRSLLLEFEIALYDSPGALMFELTTENLRSKEGDPMTWTGHAVPMSWLVVQALGAPPSG